MDVRKRVFQRKPNGHIVTAILIKAIQFREGKIENSTEWGSHTKT